MQNQNPRLYKLLPAKEEYCHIYTLLQFLFLCYLYLY